MTVSSPFAVPASMVEAMIRRRADLRARIRRAAEEAGRAPDSVTLVAVSKTQAPEAIQTALAAGQRVFGENRVQEAGARWGSHRRGEEAVELRLIGPLQTNKAEQAVALFDVIETLDRERLAEALVRAMDRLGRRPRLLVQVNTGAEPQKAGVAPRETGAFIARLRTVHGLEVEGLMAIPPEDEAAGPHFALLAALARDLGLKTLSMGMSADFETAVRFGASHVRLGTALFGARG